MFIEIATFIGFCKLFVWVQKMQKQMFFQQSKFENIMLINRKKEEAAKQLFIHYIDKSDDGEVIGGIR